MKNAYRAYEDFEAEKLKAATRKSKRQEKRASLPWGQESRVLAKKELYLSVPKIAKRIKPKRTSSRRHAFNRLRDTCRRFVLLRAKSRNFGFCEVGVACRGYGSIEVWYHILPQASGNALKYDDRNILGSCNGCNAGEYRARKCGNDLYQKRHEIIIGKAALQELKELEGRQQISTVDLDERADEYERKIGELNAK